MSKLPSIYLDTNIISLMFYRGRDVRTRACHLITCEWWERERHAFELFASRYTENELAAGKFSGQHEALALVKRQIYLPRTRQAERCAQTYLDEKIVPETKLGDAVQLALATTHEMDYLLTWNYAHLANVATQRRLDEVNARLGLRAPLLVSPETIPHVSLGQQVRRKEQ